MTLTGEELVWWYSSPRRLTLDRTGPVDSSTWWWTRCARDTIFD